MRIGRSVRGQLRGCGTTYDATELKNPRSTLSDATPVLKVSKHYFFDLPEFEQFLQDWTRSDKRHSFSCQ